MARVPTDGVGIAAWAARGGGDGGGVLSGVDG